MRKTVLLVALVTLLSASAHGAVYTVMAYNSNAYAQGSLNVDGNPAGTYSYGTASADGTLTIIATPNAGHEFKGWVINGVWQASSQADLTQPDTLTRTVTENLAIYAVFTAWTATTAINNVSAGVISPTAGSRPYTHNYSLSVYAYPQAGYRLDHWEKTVGATTTDIGRAVPTAVTVNSDMTLEAIFAVARTLNLSVSGNGTTDVATGTTEYSDGDIVSITATPSIGHEFVSWTVDGLPAYSTANPLDLTMSANHTVTAVFTDYIVTMAAGGAGSGTLSPTVGAHPYVNGATVSLSATANSGSAFDHWEFSDASPNVTTNPYNYTVSADVTVTGVFVVTHTLAVSSTGNGSTDQDGTSTQTEGAVVNITPTPTGSHVLRYWIVDGVQVGDSFDVGNLPANPLAVTMNADHTVQAVFSSWTLTMAKSPTAGGTVTPAPTTYYVENNYATTLNAVANSGYRFDYWDRNGTNIGSIASVAVTVTSNVTYTAMFVQQFSLTATVSPAGSGTVSPNSGTYDADEAVIVTATPAAHYAFDHWEGDVTGTTNPVTVTMDANKSFTAVFTQITYDLTVSASPVAGGTVTPPSNTYVEGTVVQLTATPAAGYRFVQWTGDATGSTNPVNVTMDANKTITAEFVQQYTLTTAVSPSGAGSVPPGGVYDSGEVVNLTATAFAGYKFDHWEGDASGSTNPLSVTMNASKTITAVFVVQYLLTTAVSPSGAGTVTPGGYYDSGAVVSVEATAYAGYRFDHWAGDATGTTSPVNVTMSANRSVTAVFIAQYELDVQVDPVGAGSVGSVNGTYDSGDVVSVTATPAATYVFDHWEGDAAGSVNPLSVTMDANKSITAVFTLITYDLTTAVSPAASGTVDPSSGTYTINSVVQLTATPAATYRFDHWEGDATGTDNPVSVTMDANKSVTAVFVIDTYTLTTAASPVAGGTVDPASGPYTVDELVSITATPNANYRFDHWEGDVSGSSNPVTVTMDSDKTVTAVFELITYTLTTSVAPDGSGTVSPDSGEYTSGTGVLITATPETGYVFDHWGVDLTGTTNPTTVTMDSDKSITAYFVPACQVSTVDVLEPVNDATITVDPSALDVTIPLTVAVDCITDVASVTFSIDDFDPVIVTTPDASDHFSAVSPAVNELGFGLHTLIVAVTSVTDPSTAIYGSAQFTIALSITDPDTDMNGLPDYPFAYLSADGDTYVSTVPVTGTDDERITSVRRWEGPCADKASPVLTVEDPLDTNHVVTVTVPEDLLECGESGIVILQMAHSLAGLYGTTAASAMTGEPDVRVEGSLYVEVSIIVTDNMGATYAEIDPARLAENPVQIAIEGLEFVEGGTPSLYSYPTATAHNETTGLQIAPMTGAWTMDEVDNLEVGETSLTADLIGLSTFAAYEGPALQTNPSDEYLYVFGYVELGSAKDVTFKVTNAGGETLDGAVSATAPFSIVGTSTYSLGAGESASITVRFTPTVTGAITGTVTFTGADGAAIQVVGTGYEFAGCTGISLTSETSGTPKGDLLLVGLVLMALVASGRVYARRRQNG